MEAYQLRVVKEKNELDAKRDSLDNFIRSPAFQTISKVERNLLIDQAQAMENYSIILWSRIKLWREA